MSIDIVSSFDYANISNGDELFPSAWGGDSYDAHQKGILAHRIGMNFNFRIYDNLYFKTGLRYVKIGDGYSIINSLYPRSSFGPFESLPSVNWHTRGVPISSTMKFVQLTLIHKYWELPLIVKYEFKENKQLQFFIESGLSPHLYISSADIKETNLKLTKTSIDFTNQKELNFRKIQLVAVVGFGLNYNLTTNIQPFLQPTFRYHLNAVYDNTGASLFNQYSIGLEFGIRKQFGSYFRKRKKLK